MERLQKVIANSGYCSRRKAEELILNGKVKVNGEVVNTLGSKASYGDKVGVVKVYLGDDIVHNEYIDVKNDEVQ